MSKFTHALKFGAEVAIVIALLKYGRAGTLGTMMQSLANTIS